MGQSFQRFAQRLLTTTADLLNRMAELRILREAVRAAEATLVVSEPISPAFVASSPAKELRLTRRTTDRETFSTRHRSTAD